MIRRLRKKTKQVTKSVRQFADKETQHLTQLDSSFRDYWSRQTHKGRMELIATVVAGLLVGLLVSLAIFR